MVVKKVLIVEDDLILSMLNKRLVELLGHKVVKCLKSGEEAVKYSRENDLDLILMDVRLKNEMDGISAMTEISKFCETPAIYITGNSDRVTRQRAEKTNMLAFCVKPVNYDELERIIGNVKEEVRA